MLFLHSLNFTSVIPFRWVICFVLDILTFNLMIFIDVMTIKSVNDSLSIWQQRAKNHRTQILGQHYALPIL